MNIKFAGTHSLRTAICLTMIYLDDMSRKTREGVKTCLDQRKGFSASAIMQCSGWPENGTVLILAHALW